MKKLPHTQLYKLSSSAYVVHRGENRIGTICSRSTRWSPVKVATSEATVCATNVPTKTRSRFSTVPIYFAQNCGTYSLSTDIQQLIIAPPRPLLLLPERKEKPASHFLYIILGHLINCDKGSWFGAAVSRAMCLAMPVFDFCWCANWVPAAPTDSLSQQPPEMQAPYFLLHTQRSNIQANTSE